MSYLRAFSETINMVEIILRQGRVRELEAEDLPALIRMSEEKDIQDFYFAKDVPSMADYWQERLKDQMELRAKTGWIRPVYNLPIEQQISVTGLLAFHVEPYVHCSSEASGPDKHKIELSYFVGQEFRRQGIMRKVLINAIPFAFEELDAGSVCGVCLKENEISQSLLGKVGLQKKWEGICQQERAKDREVVVYGITLAEYSCASKMSMKASSTDSPLMQSL